MGPSQGRFSQLAVDPRARRRDTGLDARRGRHDDGAAAVVDACRWACSPGRPFEPAKRSAIHGRHRELGATVRWAGDWRRAYDYGDPEAEALAVHEPPG